MSKRHVETSGELRVNTRLSPEPHFFLHDWATDDAFFKVERTWRWLRPQALVAVTEALATGRTTEATEVHDGSTFHVEYAFEDPQGERSTLGLAQQSLWFYPMNEDRMTFNIRAGDAIAALGRSVRWALVQLDDSASSAASWRKHLERAVCDLDLAARRCGVPYPGMP